MEIRAKENQDTNALCRRCEYQRMDVNYIGFHDKGMLLAGGCGDTNGRPQIDKTDYLRQVYEFGKGIYQSSGQKAKME